MLYDVSDFTSRGVVKCLFDGCHILALLDK
jgi:hypothetical protein